MGLFDYIKCEMPLPETPVPPPTSMFQTKDTDDMYMTIHTITANGRLMWKPYKMVEVPKAERPYPDAPDDDIRSIMGCVKRVEEEPEAIEFHGDIHFYESHDGGWWEYCARFTDGVCTRITLVEFTPPSSPTHD